MVPLAPLLRGPARQQLAALWRDTPASSSSSASSPSSSSPSASSLDDDEDAEAEEAEEQQAGGKKGGGKKGAGKKADKAAKADKGPLRLHVPAVTHLVAADLCGEGGEGRELVAEVSWVAGGLLQRWLAGECCRYQPELSQPNRRGLAVHGEWSG